MSNRSSRAGFALKTRNRFAFLQVFVREYIRPDGFHGDLSGHQILIARVIDLAHRAAAQTFLQKVTTREKAAAGQSALGVGSVLRADEHVVFIARLAPGTLTHRLEVYKRREKSAYAKFGTSKE